MISRQCANWTERTAAPYLDANRTRALTESEKRCVRLENETREVIVRAEIERLRQ